MYLDKTYTGNTSINILKYSTLHTLYYLLCIAAFIIWVPLTYRDGLSIEGWRALLSLVMHGFCSNKALYSASLSYTMFLGAAAIAWRVLQNGSVHCFLGIGSLVFLNFGMVLETKLTLRVTEPDFCRKAWETLEKWFRIGNY